VVADAKRRTFTAEYKLRMLAEADAATAQPGAIGALLRRDDRHDVVKVVCLWRNGTCHRIEVVGYTVKPGRARVVCSASVA
jgi:hypothetical protein